MRLIALCPLLVLTLSGCSAVAYKATMPDVSLNCVGDLKSLPATPLRFPVIGEEPDEHEGYVEFASLAGCYRPADATAVPVALYRLESIAPPAEVKVSVSLSTGGTFAASLDVLDEQWNSIRRYGFQEFVRRGSMYSLDVFVNASQRRPAYLLLTPDTAHVGRTDTTSGSQSNATPILAGPVVFTYFSSVEVQSVNPLLQGGKVRVVARPQVTALGVD